MIPSVVPSLDPLAALLGVAAIAPPATGEGGDFAALVAGLAGEPPPAPPPAEIVFPALAAALLPATRQALAAPLPDAPETETPPEGADAPDDETDPEALDWLDLPTLTREPAKALQAPAPAPVATAEPVVVSPTEPIIVAVPIERPTSVPIRPAAERIVTAVRALPAQATAAADRPAVAAIGPIIRVPTTAVPSVEGVVDAPLAAAKVVDGPADASSPSMTPSTAAPIVPVIAPHRPGHPAASNQPARGAMIEHAGQRPATDTVETVEQRIARLLPRAAAAAPGVVDRVRPAPVIVPAVAVASNMTAIEPVRVASTVSVPSSAAVVPQTVPQLIASSSTISVVGPEDIALPPPSVGPALTTPQPAIAPSPVAPAPTEIDQVPPPAPTPRDAPAPDRPEVSVVPVASRTAPPEAEPIVQVEPGAAPAALPVTAPLAIAPTPPAPGAAPVAVPLTLPPVDTARSDWIDTLVERIEIVRAEAGVRHALLRLAPDALGAVEVRVEHQARGEIAVVVQAETAHGRAVLAEAAPRLAELIEARGLRLADASVDTGRGGDRRPPAPEPRHSDRPAGAAEDTDDATLADTGERLA